MYGVFQRDDLVRAFAHVSQEDVSERNPLRDTLVDYLIVQGWQRPTRTVLERLRGFIELLDALYEHLEDALCPHCYRRMDKGEPHTDDCPSAQHQDEGDRAIIGEISERENVASAVHDLLVQLHETYQSRLQNVGYSASDRSDARALLRRAEHAIRAQSYRAAFTILNAVDLILT